MSYACAYTHLHKSHSQNFGVKAVKLKVMVLSVCALKLCVVNQLYLPQIVFTTVSIGKVKLT